MCDSFFDKSQEIANRFLQNIVFIDDKAFSEADNTNQDFDALKISQVFAESQKICAVYRPERLEDINNLIELAKKADVTVLDWQINIKKEQPENEEEDEEEDDPRGPHSKRIIRTVLTDSVTGNGSLKLIVIFTGEKDLNGITDEIYGDLHSQGTKNLKKEACKIITENAKILITAKPDPEETGEQKFKHTPDLNKFVVTYEDLPSFILTEFSKMTSGVLSNFALNSLTILRNNTFRLVNSFDKQLDAAFILHRVLLPNQDEAGNHLVQMFSDSIKAMLNYNKSSEVLEVEILKDWVNQRSFGKEVNIAGNQFKIDSDFVNDCIQNDFLYAVANKLDETLSNSKKKKIASYYNNLFKDKPDIFFQGDEVNLNEKFSILTHHSSNHKLESTVPRLTLGTIIKKVDAENYYLCIQAKCDSVRIRRERKFIFLELETVSQKGKFHFVVENGGSFVYLKIAKDTFAIKTMKFNPVEETQTVLAQLKAGHYFFESIYEEKFIWIADLTDAHAQRVANNYASKLSRVGLDESEWLRRWASLA